MDTKGGKWRGDGGGGMNWEIGLDMYTLICIKWIPNKNLLYKKINKIKLKKITIGKRIVSGHTLRIFHDLYQYGKCVRSC